MSGFDGDTPLFTVYGPSEAARAAPTDFETFAAARATHMFRTALYLCGDWYLAEDLTQSTLANLFRHWNRVRRAENPAAYAQSALVKTFLSHRRRRSSTERPAQDLPQDTYGPDAPELRVVLLAALRRLEPKDRAVVVLRYWEDLSVEQTAAMLGTSAGAVRMRAGRALARLRADLGDDFAALIG